MAKKRIGIVGYGRLGQFLVEEIKREPTMELAFVWNRTKTAFSDSSILDSSDILDSLEDFVKRSCDLIVEVAHPSICFQYGANFLKHCDFMIGSPSALADLELESKLKSSAVQHGLYVPSGAFWGGEDIRKMSDQGTLTKLKVTMTKHPSSLKLVGQQLQERCAQVLDKAVILLEGPIRTVCPVAPNNVNTMAVAAIAARNLGFDRVTGCIVADPNSLDWHTTEIEVTGPSYSGGQEFTVKTVRRSPAIPGAVTGMATFQSFRSSLLGAHGKGPGIHLC